MLKDTYAQKTTMAVPLGPDLDPPDKMTIGCPKGTNLGVNKKLGGPAKKAGSKPDQEEYRPHYVRYAPFTKKHHKMYQIMKEMFHERGHTL